MEKKLRNKKINFNDLDYKGFQRLARNQNLSKFEKIGFPNEYREGKEKYIFNDIISKVSALKQRSKTILDIGPGCSDLPSMIIELCKKNGHRLILIDSPEMLKQLPNHSFINKIPGLFPQQCDSFIRKNQNSIDAIICYSVFHYIYIDTNLFDFIDKSLSLLKNNGQFLVADIPNVSKRKRFFSSQTGIDFHKKFMKTDIDPVVTYNKIETGNIDDSVILSVVCRARCAGYDAYILPQDKKLPMSNRREDILFCKP